MPACRPRRPARDRNRVVDGRWLPWRERPRPVGATPHSVPGDRAMPQISTADFKGGISLDLPDGLFNLVQFQHVKPGKGGAFVRTKLKNLRNGAVLDRTFRAGE